MFDTRVLTLVAESCEATTVFSRQSENTGLCMFVQYLETRSTVDKYNLAKEIASYRCTMNRLSKGKSLTDPTVIRLRQGLDILIHKYIFELNHTSPPKQLKFITTEMVLTKMVKPS